LGYFATTGVAQMDYLIGDPYVTPSKEEGHFTETVWRLPETYLCFAPPDVALETAPLPAWSAGAVTFGSFNNLTKMNDVVVALWAKVLLAVPGSRLFLKTKQLNDTAVRDQTRLRFAAHGIESERLLLEGFSPRAELLAAYHRVDVALDPFPYPGGTTSVEALWMGVPVITWPQSRVVSRQTYAFLNQIGLPELAAKDAEDYVRIAVKLANDKNRLLQLRGSLRQRMQDSLLCDVAGFTRTLEDSLIGRYRRIESEPDTMLMTPKTLLNVGAGHPQSGARIPVAFQTPEWKEVRLDIDPANQPDVIGTMLDMSAVADGSVDAIYSSHTIEHLYPNEIPQAMQEFLRVLKPDGFLIVTCPDLQAAAQMIAEDKLMETAYTSPAGPVTPFDIVYSHREFTGRDKPYMAHHCGFTLKVLLGTLKSNGFAAVAGKSRPKSFDLWIVATKQPMEETTLRELAGKVLPG
jgi:predicted SAM-dependent methyltransferase